MEAKTSSACSRSQDACTRMYPKAVHQKLMPNDGVRVRRVSDSRTIPQAAGTLGEGNPYVHTLQSRAKKWAPAKTLGAQCFTGDFLVGAVGIENNTDRNFKDLEEMLGNAKELKRNNRECKGILIGPSMAPHFSGAEIPLLFLRSTKSGVGFRSNPRRGWQADDQLFKR